MKHLNLFAIVILLAINGCKKNANDTITDRSSVDSFQPVTVGSNWTYDFPSALLGNQGKITLVATGKVFTIDGRPYQTVADTVDGFTNFYYQEGHAYYIGNFANDQIEYLDDSLPVGGTWTAQIYNGMTNGITYRIIGAVIETDMTRTINGKTVTGITHTRVKRQLDSGTGFHDDPYYTPSEYYSARGVGLIEMFENGKYHLVLTSYEIK